MGSEHDLAFEGAKNQIKGKVREVTGIVTDNEAQQAKGKAETTGGKLQSAAADAIKHVKDAVKKA